MSARRFALVGGLGCLALFLPGMESPPPPAPATRAPFAWNRDAEWARLEAHFKALRVEGCSTVNERLAQPQQELEALLATLEAEALPATAPELERTEALLFDFATVRAACPGDMTTALAWLARFRDAVKLQSTRWNLEDPAQRARLYRLLYGARAALEEALLQQPKRDVAPLALGRPVSPGVGTPKVVVHGVELHSGDLLVSRGGAATSALIARGSDYPGNFSHVALLHVDAQTGAATIVEAHIEVGVKTAPLAEYLADKKLRILALRPRALKDPLLPHRAATNALERARAGHIAYDFAMDSLEHGKLFCSEVAWAAYEAEGVKLWPGRSHISAAGTRAWLWSVGVRHFDTLEPSDLEYDPQLVAVAEWFDADALKKDHLDNAVTDVMLDEAQRGATLDFPTWKLPLARLAKAWSTALVAVGRAGPIPEGMSSEAALRSVAYTARHAELKARLESRVAEFVAREGYPPPYWQLVALAR